MCRFVSFEKTLFFGLGESAEPMGTLLKTSYGGPRDATYVSLLFAVVTGRFREKLGLHKPLLFYDFVLPNAYLFAY